MMSVMTDDMETSDRTFDFDELLMTSKAYRSTFASSWVKKIRGERKKAGKGLEKDFNTDAMPNEIISQPKPKTRIDTDFSWLRIGPVDGEVEFTSAESTYRGHATISATPTDSTQNSNTLIGSDNPDANPEMAQGDNQRDDANANENGRKSLESPDKDTDSNNSRDMSTSPSIEDENIDFEFVYALHTFVAIVEGQANATKGDAMVLLDDSNSYWWLIRNTRDSSIGYLPAEHIETPTERLARLNKHRNIDLAQSILGDESNRRKKKAMRPREGRSKGKIVRFAPLVYIPTPEYSDSEGEEEGHPNVADSTQAEGDGSLKLDTGPPTPSEVKT
jgi:hypothetical protein